MKHELSILIPNFNGDCRQQVVELNSQASAVEGLDYEIIVADDGSTDPLSIAHGREIDQLPHCRFIERGFNSGRAAIRNFLASQASREWLLFIDGDMSIPSCQFLSNYLEGDDLVVYGGYRIGYGERTCLRYVYEKANEHMHTAEQRRTRPYQHFHTSNFLVRRDVMVQHPFDERFRYYGYEDVLWGKQLRQTSIPITHIDNPVGFFTFEDNSQFISKTEESLRTLHQFRDELRGYSQILTFVDGLHSPLLRGAIRLWHRCFGSIERRWLCGNHPSLRIFKLYKLGYFITLESNSGQN